MVQTRKHKIALRRNTSGLLLLLAFGTVPAASAQTLVQLFEAARTTDATYQGARAQYEANLAKADQSRALILPSANLTAGASRNTYDSTTPPVEGPYTALTASVGATQPLYRPGNWAGYEQGLKLADIAKAQLLVAEQDLVIRVAQAYFDVLAAQDTLAFVQAQKAAVAEQLASARRNFEVGTATITDTREAQARHDLATAQEIAAQNDVQVKRAALDQLVGRTDVQPQPLLTPVMLPPLQPATAEEWVSLTPNSSAIRKAQVGLDYAKLETTRARAGHLPTADLVASVSKTDVSGSGSVTVKASDGTNSSIGVEVNVPVFAGFAVQNRIRETLALEEKSERDLDNAKRSVTLATRQAFFGVQSGQAQVKALEAAESSAKLALEATQLGYRVGVRVNKDVLDAQTALASTQKDLYKARYDVIVATMKLRQASGSLRPDDLDSLNRLLLPR